MAKRMRTPPMVGTPFFEKWLSGPSSRITWPICLRSSQAMKRGPTITRMRKAVTALPMERKVM